MNWKAVSDHLLGDANYYDLKARRAPCATERDALTATANTLRSLGNALLAGLPGANTLHIAHDVEKARGYENP